MLFVLKMVTRNLQTTADNWVGKAWQGASLQVMSFYRGVCRILTGPCIEEGQSGSILPWGLFLGLVLIQKGL